MKKKNIMKKYTNEHHTPTHSQYISPHTIRNLRFICVYPERYKAYCDKNYPGNQCALKDRNDLQSNNYHTLSYTKMCREWAKFCRKSCVLVNLLSLSNYEFFIFIATIGNFTTQMRKQKHFLIQFILTNSEKFCPVPKVNR